MQAITTIGFDIAKSVFQVHGVDAAGQVIVRRQLKRRQVIAFRGGLGYGGGFGLVAISALLNRAAREQQRQRKSHHRPM
jgi:transposase